MTTRKLIRVMLIACVWVLAGVRILGQAASSTEIAGDWILVLERYGQTDYQRMLLKVDGDRVTVETDGFPVEGELRNGRLDLRGRGERQTTTMSGVVNGNSMSGQMAQGDVVGTWHATRPMRRTLNAPTMHTFEPTSFPQVFSPSIAAVLRVYPGDTVKTWTLDAGGVSGKDVRHSRGFNALTGPFYVEGAMPGDTLVVTLRRVQLNRNWAFSGNRIEDGAITSSYLTSEKPPQYRNVRWALDREHGVARLAEPSEALANYTVPLRPMIGSIGVAPNSRTVSAANLPGNWGGNMDYSRIREGATLYLPVRQPGALFSLGDGHAAQGDGELTGNALETSLDVEFTVDLIAGKRLRAPRVEDGDSLMALGIERSMFEAFQWATNDMALWLKERHSLTATDVALIMGTVVQYDIAEVVDEYFVVAARVPKNALTSIKRVER